MQNKESLLKYGEKVSKSRKKENLTQKELAEKVGVSHEWICKIEKGKANSLSTSLISKINEILDVQFIL